MPIGLVLSALLARFPSARFAFPVLGLALKWRAQESRRMPSASPKFRLVLLFLSSAWPVARTKIAQNAPASPKFRLVLLFLSSSWTQSGTHARMAARTHTVTAHTHERRHARTNGGTHAYGAGAHTRMAARTHTVAARTSARGDKHAHDGGTHAHEGGSTRTDSGTHAHTQHARRHGGTPSMTAARKDARRCS